MNPSYDYLTGLPDINYFNVSAKQIKDKMIMDGLHPVMLVLDLCGMKRYNLSYGFSEGNKIIRFLANILSEQFGKENCSRLSSDHFAVVSTEDVVEEKLSSVFLELKKYNEGNTLPVRVGIYEDSIETVDVDIACDRAKYACDLNKNTTESIFAYFDESMLKEMAVQYYILENLDKALSKGWIKVYYQPIIRSVNGRISDEEALARWIDPEQGLINPASFIPVLENSKLIYKLDLYVVDHIIEKLKRQFEKGHYVIPQSVNISRVDFDKCDMVHEVCRRMDKFKIPHDKLNIEITESGLGANFAFMKEQIENFRKLGFKVWIDDFGSGYSSFDYLQDIQCDVLKIDMKFIQSFGNNERNRIILTEIIKLASELDMDTVAEGAEDKTQIDFLKEIGCTKLQGFYYSKAIPENEIAKKDKDGGPISYEKPDESGYYESLGKINLYGLNFLNNDDDLSVKKHLSVLPVGILESSGNHITIIRCNNSYKEFLKENFDISEEDLHGNHTDKLHNGDSGIFAAMKKCGTGRIAFEEVLGRNRVNSMLKYIAHNPVTGADAYVIIVFNIQDIEHQEITYAHIANALSSDYINLYYVDLNTEEFTEYQPDPKNNTLFIKETGKNFFRRSLHDASHFVYESDLETLTYAFTKENILKSINETGSFTLTYRLYINGNPTYVAMKAAKIGVFGKHIIIGVNNVDSYMKHQELLNKIKQEQVMYNRMAALSDNYMAMYVINVETDEYIEHSATSEYEKLGVFKAGKNFFEDTAATSLKLIYPEDYSIFTRKFTKENIYKEIKENGYFEVIYRLVMNEIPVYTSTRASIVEEDGKDVLIIGVSNIDSFVRKEQKYTINLLEAQAKANIDALTGVKNKHAYVDVEAELSQRPTT